MQLHILCNSETYGVGSWNSKTFPVLLALNFDSRTFLKNHIFKNFSRTFQDRNFFKDFKDFPEHVETQVYCALFVYFMGWRLNIFQWQLGLRYLQTQSFMCQTILKVFQIHTHLQLASSPDTRATASSPPNRGKEAIPFHCSKYCKTHHTWN